MLLDILCHIEMIDKCGRLHSFQRFGLGSVGQQRSLGFLQRIEAAGIGCAGSSFGIVAVMVIEIAIGIAQNLDSLIVGNEASHMFRNGTVNGYLLQLLIREGNQILEGEGFQFLFNEFFQRIIAAPVNDDTIHIAIQAELHEIHIDLDRNFIIRDGGMSDRDIP